MNGRNTPGRDCEPGLSNASLRPRVLLEAVVFDMDGVLIDSHPVHRKAWKEFLHSIGEAVSEQDLDYILQGRKRREILRHFLGDLPEDQLAEYGKQKDDFFQRAFADVKLIPGILRLLKSLQSNGIAVAVATSASRLRTYSTLTRLALQPYFAVVITGDDVVAGKPDPSIYRTACERLSVSPGHVVAIEDAVPGIESAIAAGTHCIGVISNGNHPEALRRAGARHLIRDFVGLTASALPHLLE